MQKQEMIEKLKKSLKPSRFEHSIGVMNTAVKLAKHYGVSEEKAMLCGLLHDCAKGMTKSESIEFCKQNSIAVDEVCKYNHSIIHQYIGAYVAKIQYGISNCEILDAIACHTTGKAGMTNLEKILFLADMIEPNRKKKPYDGLEELEKLCYEDLDAALVFGLNLSIKHVIEEGKLVHLNSINARNDILIKKIEENDKKI